MPSRVDDLYPRLDWLSIALRMCRVLGRVEALARYPYFEDTMGSPQIELRLGQFRRRLRQILTLYGVSWLLVVTAGITLASAILDWLFDLSTGVRAILLLSLVGAGIWTTYHLLALPLLFRLRDVDLALRVESQFPGLNDELASAVEFAKEPVTSDRSGSPALKAAVVAHATHRLVAIDFGQALDWTAARRAAACAGSVLLLALLFVLASPGSVVIALARLVNPFGGTAWPRQTHLVLVNPPQRLARGEPFHLTVQVAQGRVPVRADVHYEFDGGDVARDPLRPQADRQFSGGLETVTRSFTYYVSAGDGLTEPSFVEVVPPPELQRLRVRLTFPSYVGQPPEQLPEDKGQVRAVWGTEVDLSARSSKPLDRAEVRIGTSKILRADLSDDRTELHARFQLEESGSYWIALRDQLGFENRQASRYDLKVVEDQPPDVFIERPASDIQVTANADVPLRVSIKDDFGVQDATLLHSGSAPDSMNDVPIWSSEARPRRQIVDHVWHLSELGLTAGSSITYRVAARDADDVRGPHVGQSRQLRLIVVTAEELARSIDEKQTQVYQELERLRALQVDSRLQVIGLSDLLVREPKLSKSDLARLQSAEMLQRQVQRQITSPNEGLQNKVAQIQQDLQNNHIRDTAVSEQMEAVASGLDQIAREHLPLIEQSLGRVRKAAEESAPAQAQSTELAQALEHQDGVVATLDELLEQMGKWETFRGIARDVRDLHDQQEQIATQTQTAGRDTIGKPRDSLPTEAQAELDRITARQQQVREQLGRVQRKMDQMAERLAPADPIGAESLRDAVSGSRQSGTSELMQKAAANVQQNQVGAAEAAQRQAADDLKQMLDTLENNTERDLAKIVEKLRQAEAKLSDLRKRQLEQLQRTKEAQSAKDAEQRRRELQQLARQQKELEQETARLAQQLRRLRAQQAGKTSASAANRMGQAAQQMQQGEGEQSEAEQQRVLEELQKAQQEVAQARREAEAQLAMEQLARIADTLAALHARQQTLKEETTRLDTERLAKGNWTRPQLASLRGVVETQQTVRTDTEEAREVLTSAPVFALTLTRAMSNMERAVGLLNERRADAETQIAQQAAVDRFAQLLDALKNDPDAQAGQSEDAAGGGGAGGGQQDGPPRDGIPPIAQLKMLRSLQIEINERTLELDDSRQRQKGLSPTQEKELESLSAEQGILADLVRKFAEPDDEGDSP
jgi:hypothetical protein